MHLKGNHTFDANAKQVWDCLMDPDTLARITPGITKLELVEADHYKAIAEVKMGPVKGSFSGDLAVAEKEEPKHFLLKVSQKSRIGNVSADVAIDIEEVEGERSELRFDGKAKMSGLLARTGQRVLSGVANTLTKQFFKALEDELQKEQA
ncbi:MAG: carbon monoxide dehydrogenase subunit G [Saprospiraceae bacterium]|nr:carbon monoxide dehydrogenase subunit G [Saprospiraceae bacterium]